MLWALELPEFVAVLVVLPDPFVLALVGAMLVLYDHCCRAPYRVAPERFDLFAVLAEVRSVVG